MNILKPGTLCVVIGGSGENAGRIVTVLSYVGPFYYDPTITEGYRIRTASGRPFASVRLYALNAIYNIVRNAACECTADRRNLRPLVDPNVDAEEREAEVSAPRMKCQEVEHELTAEG